MLQFSDGLQELRLGPNKICFHLGTKYFFENTVLKRYSLQQKGFIDGNSQEQNYRHEISIYKTLLQLVLSREMLKILTSTYTPQNGITLVYIHERADRAGHATERCSHAYFFKICIVYHSIPFHHFIIIIPIAEIRQIP